MSATLSRGDGVNPRSTVTLDQQDYLWIIVLQLIIVKVAVMSFMAVCDNISLGYWNMQVDNHYVPAWFNSFATM